MKDINRTLKVLEKIEDIFVVLFFMVICIFSQIALELLLDVKYDLRASITNLPKVGFGAVLYHYLIVKKR